MDSTSLILVGFIAGMIGMGYIMFGRKQHKPMALISGMGLCAYPYFVHDAWLMIAIGVVLIVLPMVIRWE